MNKHDKSKEEVKKQKIDSYFRKYSKEHNITQDYIIDAVNRVRYNKKDKKVD